MTNRTQRLQQINDRIADRLKHAAYLAFYIYHRSPTKIGTVIKSLEKWD